MSRPKNPIAKKQLSYSGNRLIELYLEDLVRSGFYGGTPGEAAERLISQGIKKAIVDGEITARPNSDLET